MVTGVACLPVCVACASCRAVCCRGLVRQLSIDQLDNEGRRVSIYDKGTPEGKTPMFQRTVSMPGVHKRVINELLRPRQWKPNHEDRHFMLSVRRACTASLQAPTGGVPPARGCCCGTQSA